MAHSVSSFSHRILSKRGRLSYLLHRLAVEEDGTARLGAIDDVSVQGGTENEGLLYLPAIEQEVADVGRGDVGVVVHMGVIDCHHLFSVLVDRGYGQEASMVAAEADGLAGVVEVDAIVVAEGDDVGTLHALQDVHPRGAAVDADDVDVGVAIVTVVADAVAIFPKAIGEQPRLPLPLRLLLCADGAGVCQVLYSLRSGS